MRYRFSRIAAGELREAYDYVAQDSPNAAQSVADRIREALETLGESPSIGRLTQDAAVREHPVPGLPYIIVYEPRGNEIFVLHVWHGRRQRPMSWRS